MKQSVYHRFKQDSLGRIEIVAKGIDRVVHFLGLRFVVCSYEHAIILR